MQVKGKAAGWEMRWLFWSLVGRNFYLGLRTGKRAGAGVKRGEALLIVLPTQAIMGGYGEGSQKDLTAPVMEEGGSTQMPGLC